MEKIIKVLGGIKQNPLGEPEPDLGAFLKNMMYIMIALISVAFTAGSYLNLVKQLPERLCATESKVDILERKQEISSVQLSNISETLIAIKTDVREIRAAQIMRRDR